MAEGFVFVVCLITDAVIRLVEDPGFAESDDSAFRIVIGEVDVLERLATPGLLD